MKRNILSGSISYLRYAVIAAVLLLLPASGIMAQDDVNKPSLESLEGEGTAESPFLIHDLNDLNCVAKYYNNYYGEETPTVWYFKLAHDINITFASSNGQTYQRFTDVNGDIIDYSENGEYRNEYLLDYQEYDEYYSPQNPFNLYTPNPRPFTPIGTADHPFNGVFDGGGKTIANLYFREITTENKEGTDGYTYEYDKVGNVNQDYSGLFAYCDNAEIRNLGVVDSYVEGKSVAAAVCANAKNTTLTQVYSASTVTGTPVQGALIGNAEGTVTLTNCYNVGKVGTDGGNALVGNVAEDGTVTYSGCYTLGNCSTAEGLTVASKTDKLEASTIGEAYIDGINGHPILKAVSYPLATGAYWNYEESEVKVYEGGQVHYADASLFIPTDNTPYLIYDKKDESWISYYQNIAFLHNMFYDQSCSFYYDSFFNTAEVNNSIYSWYLIDKKDLDSKAFTDLVIYSVIPKEVFYHRDNTEGYNSVCLPFHFRASHFGAEKVVGADGKEHYNVEILSFMDDYDDITKKPNEGETGNGRNGVFNFGYLYTPHFMYKPDEYSETKILDQTIEIGTAGKALLVNTPGLPEWNMHVICNDNGELPINVSVDNSFYESQVSILQNPKGDWTSKYKEPYQDSYYDEEKYENIYLDPVYPYRTYHFGSFTMIEKLKDYSSWSGQPAGTEDMTFIQDNYLTYKLAVVNGEAKFVKAVDKSGVYPFRTFIICPDFAKLDKKSEVNYSRMAILGHTDGTVTGISDVNMDGKQDIKQNGNVYSIDGRLVRKGGTDGKPQFNGLAPGIYISGGKKIVIGK